MIAGVRSNTGQMHAFPVAQSIVLEHWRNTIGTLLRKVFKLLSSFPVYFHKGKKGKGVVLDIAPLTGVM